MDALESRRSLKAASFTESVIRDFTRLSDLHGAINASVNGWVAAIHQG